MLVFCSGFSTVFGEGFRLTFILLNISNNFIRFPTPQIVLLLPAQVPSLKSCQSTLSKNAKLTKKKMLHERGIHRTGIFRVFGQQAPAFHKFPETMDTDISPNKQHSMKGN